MLFALTVVAAAICVVAGATVDPLQSGPLGLIEAMPPLFFAGLALLLVTFVLTVRRNDVNRPVVVLQLLVLAVVLYGLASWRESVARLPTGWVHAGFIDYIQRTDRPLENYDARFDWPGFFAFGAMLNELAGVTVSNLFLAWSPLVLNLLYIVPVWTIARGAGAPVRAAYLAVAFFLLLNWVGQDYYSPQGLNMLFAVCFLAVLVRVFFTQSAIVPPWLRSLLEPPLERVAPKTLARLKRWRLQPGGPSRIAITNRQKAALVGGLVIIYAACVVSHQLTPFFLIIATGALVLLNRLQLRVFPLLMLVAVLIWISYAATGFWAGGKLANLFGDVGNVGSTFNQNVDNRVTGDPAHAPVLYARLALTGGLWALAMLGVLRRLRHGRFDLVCLVGFLAPFAILGGQSYGGEAVFRVYLFGLPFAVTLLALLFVPEARAWSKKISAVIAVMLVGLPPLFFLTRYGNESFEAFTSGEYELAERAQAMAPDGSKLVTFNSYLPYRTERIEQLTFSAFADDKPPFDDYEELQKAVTPVKAGQRTFFITNRAQDEYATMVQGKPARYSASLADQAVQRGLLRVVFTNDQGRILVPIGQAS